jgi:hypothetical protein
MKPMALCLNELFYSATRRRAMERRFRHRQYKFPKGRPNNVAHAVQDKDLHLAVT